MWAGEVLCATISGFCVGAEVDGAWEGEFDGVLVNFKPVGDFLNVGGDLGGGGVDNVNWCIVVGD